MVILEKTPVKLTLKHRPLGIWMFTGSLGLVIPLFWVFVGLIFTCVFYRWWLPWFFAFCIIASIFMLIWAGEVITCTFDKTFDKVTLKHRSLFAQKVIQNSLANILDVQVQCRSWDSQDSPNYQIVLLLRLGNSLLLNFGRNSSLEDKLEIVNLIRNFLEFPPLQWI